MLPNDWYVYLIYSESKDLLYTGIAKNVEKRLSTHNKNKGAKFTKGKGPWKLLWKSKPLSHGEALSLEYKIKQLSRVEKLKLTTV